MWGATYVGNGLSVNYLFQSTLPVWGATVLLSSFICDFCISIHAPRVGSDFASCSGHPDVLHFNPRSPCGERRLPARILTTFLRFQSTLPVWGATLRLAVVTQMYYISIHAPRVGSDDIKGRAGACNRFISIHAPRVGSDVCSPYSPQRKKHFNPRSPCGERHFVHISYTQAFRFQSTLPVWGATESTLNAPMWYRISIHAPRVGSDSSKSEALQTSWDFNPRSPCGERLCSEFPVFLTL